MPAHSLMTILSLQVKHMVAPCAMGALVCLSLNSLADEDLNSSRKAALLFSNGDKLTGSPQFNNGENAGPCTATTPLAWPGLFDAAEPGAIGYVRYSTQLRLDSLRAS